MNKPLRFSLAVAAAVLVTAVSSAHSTTKVKAPEPVSAEQPPLLPLGSKAPNFSTRTIGGQHLTLRSLRGHVVLVDFWATWCAPCRVSTPTLVKLHHKFANHGLRIVGLSLDDQDSRDNIAPFRKIYHVPYTLAYAPKANTKAAFAYHTNVDPDSGQKFDHPIPPSVFLIDKKGRVRWTQLGYSEDEEQVLSKLIGKLVRD